MKITVVHTLEPVTLVGKAEWEERLRVAARAFNTGQADRILVLGGWYYDRATIRYVFNPEKMKTFLCGQGVPEYAVIVPPLSFSEMNTAEDVKHSGDEVRQAVAHLEFLGVRRAELSIVSNRFHLIWLIGPRWRDNRPWPILGKRAIWPAKIKNSGLELTLQPLPSPNHLGLRWLLFREIPLLLYTLFWDSGWTGWLAEKIHKDRCRGGHGVGG